MKTITAKPTKIRRGGLEEKRRKHWEMLSKLSDAELIEETKRRLRKLEGTFTKYSRH